MPKVKTDWEESAHAWINYVEQETHRDTLLDPVVMQLLGGTDGTLGLDVGCGQGRALNFLGADAIGIDPTPEFLTRAQELGHSKLVRSVAEQLPFRSCTFDHALSYLTMIDIPDYVGAIREVHRVLKPGGVFIVVNLNSFITAAEAGSEPLTIKNYSEARPNQVEWSNIKVVNHHRPLSHYIQAYLTTGFHLEAFTEPGDDPIPWFHVMKWRK